MLLNLHLAIGTKLDQILGDIFIDAAALQTTAVAKLRIIFNNLFSSYTSV